MVAPARGPDATSLRPGFSARSAASSRSRPRAAPATSSLAWWSAEDEGEYFEPSEFWPDLPQWPVIAPCRWFASMVRKSAGS